MEIVLAKGKKQFVCRNCGAVEFKWSGRCDSCGGWNTFEEETVSLIGSKFNFGLELKTGDASPRSTTLDSVNFRESSRLVVNLKQFNEVLGGGIVQGSICLIGGCPGIGKSTLLLQVCGGFDKNVKVLYVSGEESKSQIKLRADRLKIQNSNLFVLSEFDMQTIANEIEALQPDVVVVDSIQTVSVAQIPSSCGSVAQVKQSTYIFQKIAKEKNIATILVGHVNKEGNIAGPKVLEHIVDVVLSFEADSHFFYRVLRSVKNRFGPANEFVVFEMNSNGLVVVDNPSELLLSERPKQVSGSCVCCFVEGSKPVFVEIQAIVSKSSLPMARRMCNGFDFGKLVLMLAVLEKRVGLSFKNFDCYVNVVGAFKLDNVVGSDLALVLALVSSLKNVSVGDDVVAFGEVGLAGEVRATLGFERAVLEAQKLGFKKIFLPKSCVKKLQHFNYNVKMISIGSVKEAVLKALGS